MPTEETLLGVYGAWCEEDSDIRKTASPRLSEALDKFIWEMDQ